MIFSSLKRKRNEARHEELRQRYPINGNCPVMELTGDGQPVGRCEFALRGDYCPRHGNLSGLLVRDESVAGGRWQLIRMSQIEEDPFKRDYGELGRDFAALSER